MLEKEAWKLALLSETEIRSDFVVEPDVQLVVSLKKRIVGFPIEDMLSHAGVANWRIRARLCSRRQHTKKATAE